MRFLIVNTDYHRFLVDFYRRHPGLSSRSYEEQMRARIDTLFGMGDFYSSNLRRLGHDVYDIFANNQPLQLTWASEHDVPINRQKRLQFTLRKGLIPWLSRVEDDDWMFAVLESQIRYYRPDVVLNQALVEIPPDFWRRLKPDIPRLIGQISWVHVTDDDPSNWQLTIPELWDWPVYDSVISSFPPTVEWFRAHGVAAKLNRLAFEPRILQHLDDNPKKYDVSFVGSCAVIHDSRVKWLEHLCRNVDVKVWSPDIERTPKNSPIRDAYMGEAWGLQMYQVLKDSRITLNHHGNVPPYANNMRLYEATGTGTLLVTDDKSNLGDMFEPGVDVVAYQTAEQCVSQIEYYLSHPAEADRIAVSGQARTLQSHSYKERMRELAALVQPKPHEALCPI